MSNVRDKKLKLVMVDIETLDITSSAQLLQIGAVSSTGETFTVNVEMGNTAVYRVSPATLQWWVDDAKRAQKLASMKQNAKPIPAALVAFTEWLEKVQSDELWCNGASFDFPIIAHAYESWSMPLPWSYKQLRCYRTLLSLYPKELVSTVKEKISNSAPHDALSDAVYQLAVMRQLCTYHTVSNLEQSRSFS